MVMRVTQRNLYATVVDRMNYALSDLMESNIQAGSQKRINAPSDDPIGEVRVLNYRDTLSELDQYESNISQATGWLSFADSTMIQVNTIITRCKELAEQGATGTISAENREQISYEVRQLFEQIVALSNTRYEDKTIFSGHKTEGEAYCQTLSMTSNGNGTIPDFVVNGDSESTILVQFTQGGTLAAGMTYRWSDDGGDTWQNGSVVDPGAPSRFQLNLGGVQLDLARGSTVVANSATDYNDAEGTWMWIRPSAEYLGDDSDSVEVDPMQNSDVLGQAAGTWTDNVIVRIDEATTLADSAISFSYSLDGGSNWIQSNVSGMDAAASSATFVVPGGILTLVSNGGNTLTSGEQFVIRPRTAAINVQISETETVTINGVGKEIFGGLYQDPDASNATAVLVDNSIERNLFETVGKLVGFLETNNQQGCQEALDNLRQASQPVLNYAARVGGRENRLAVSQQVLEGRVLDNTEQMSKVEDVDLSALMTRMAQQELAYQAVLKSSSMIMQLSLVSLI